MILRKKTLAAVLSLLTIQSFVFGFHGKGYQYLYPNPDALHVDPSAGLIIRLEKVSPSRIANLSKLPEMKKRFCFSRTVPFSPEKPFRF